MGEIEQTRSKKVIKKAESFLIKYGNNPLIKSILSIIPYGGIPDSYASDLIQRIEEKRLLCFFDELDKDSSLAKSIPVDLPGNSQGEDFVHKSIITLKKVVNTRREEKIRIFARLFRSSFIDKEFLDIDDFEEDLNILDQLTPKGIALLEILHRHSSFYPKKDNENDIQWIGHFWDDFVEEATNTLQINKSEIIGLLNRLTSTGCFKFITGSFYGYQGDKGSLTMIYYRLRKVIFAMEQGHQE